MLPMGRILSEAQRRKRASPMPRPRRCVGPNLHQYVLSYNSEVGLLAVVARAGPQVGGVGVSAVADHIGLRLVLLTLREAGVCACGE